MDYDASGNLAWSAAGLGLGFAGTGACNRETVPAAQKSIRSYDPRNRLTLIDHPVGTADVSYSYYADGAPWTVASSDGGTWTYTYNKRRLLTGETLSIDGHSFAFGHGYTVHGHRASLSYPGGLTVAYAPNALGQSTQAGSYATGVTYHPNGSVAGFAYGNGTVCQRTKRFDPPSDNILDPPTRAQAVFFPLSNPLCRACRSR